MRIFSRTEFIAKLGNRPVWALAASPLLILPAGYLMSVTGTDGAAVAAALADPLSVFADRSPGPRGAGVLAQTKHAYAKSKPSTRSVRPVPGERVLGNVRSGPLTPPLTSQPDFEAPLFAGALPTDIPVQVGSAPVVPGSFPIPGGVGGGVVISLPGGGGTGGLPGGGGTGGSPGGGGTGGPPGGGDATIIPPMVSAVPEPATWLTMFAGFFSVGLALRSQRRRNGRDVTGLAIGKRR